MLKDICALEKTPLADEIWCALDAHVKDYASNQAKVMKGIETREPAPDFSLPKNNNVFDNMVDDMVAEAAELEVDEVISEIPEKRKMATSDMFGHYKAQQ